MRNGTVFGPTGPRWVKSAEIDAAIQHLLGALSAAADDAGRLGTTDTGARQAAAALLDARIAVHQAITAAGRFRATTQDGSVMPGQPIDIEYGTAESATGARPLAEMGWRIAQDAR